MRFCPQDLIVLESTPAGGLISVLSDEGTVKSSIVPSQIAQCGPLRSPNAVAVDSAHNVIVSESGPGGRIVLFGADARLQLTLMGGRSGPAADGPPEESRWPAGLTVGPDDRLYVVMRGEKFAEVCVFAY